MSDLFLRPGLSPATDVELYASEAAGGTTTPVTASTTAIGVAAIAKVVSYARSVVTAGIGVPLIARQTAVSQSLPATAVGVAAVSLVVVPGLPEQHTVSASVTATGTASVTIVRTFKRSVTTSVIGSVSVTTIVPSVVSLVPPFDLLIGRSRTEAETLRLLVETAKSPALVDLGPAPSSTVDIGTSRATVPDPPRVLVGASGNHSG